MRGLAVVLFVLTSGLITSTQSRRVTAPEAGQFIGEVATVCGTVVTFGCYGAEGLTLLYVDGPPQRPTFTIGIRRADRVKFPRPLEMQFLSRAICVTGRLQKEKVEGGALMMIEDPTSLVLADPGQERHSGETIYNTCDENLERPRLVRETKPVYTQEARLAKIQGSVIMQGVVRPDGRLHNLVVTRSLPAGLDEEALKSARQWEFQPGTYDGNPVSVLVTVQMSFTLRR